MPRPSRTSISTPGLGVSRSDRGRVHRSSAHQREERVERWRANLTDMPAEHRTWWPPQGSGGGFCGTGRAPTQSRARTGVYALYCDRRVARDRAGLFSGPSRPERAGSRAHALVLRENVRARHFYEAAAGAGWARRSRTAGAELARFATGLRRHAGVRPGTADAPRLTISGGFGTSRV